MLSSATGSENGHAYDPDDIEDHNVVPYRLPSNNQRHLNNFANSKAQCLGKRDKSSAGRIDPPVVQICALVNGFDCFYTTSSCAGRCFFYTGPGRKQQDVTESCTGAFRRYRVSHASIRDASRYFNFETMTTTDPTGGGDPIPGESDVGTPLAASPWTTDRSLWLRFEPFILHVACRSMHAAAVLMNTARPIFKNVGLTTWKDSRYLVAIWGDEGLDAPMWIPDSTNLAKGLEQWYVDQINERFSRNGEKISRLGDALQGMTVSASEEDPLSGHDVDIINSKTPRSYDVIGDVAVFQASAVGGGDGNRAHERSEEQWIAAGEALLRKNKGINIAVVRRDNLVGSERAAGHRIVAGQSRDPLIATHSEYGMRCVVDLNQTFFSPRMAQERLRICQQVARGENVLVLFAGVAMDALQIAGRTEATQITTVENNPVAIQCFRRSVRMLKGNTKYAAKYPGAADRLDIRDGDVRTVLPSLPRDHYHRVFAPRPKGATEDQGGKNFLSILLPVLKQTDGECHWYDFVTDQEFPTCQRTRDLITTVCGDHGLQPTFLHSSRVGSVAMRQYRVCVDFRVHPT